MLAGVAKRVKAGHAERMTADDAERVHEKLEARKAEIEKT